VTKKRAQNSESPDAEAASPPGPFEQLGRRIDQLPESDAFQEAMAAFRDEIEGARRMIQELRGQSRSIARNGQNAGEDFDAADLLDHTLQYVRRNPCRSLLAAALTGVLLGRLWRR
jgi:hypothetical protein